MTRVLDFKFPQSDPDRSVPTMHPARKSYRPLRLSNTGSGSDGAPKNERANLTGDAPSKMSAEVPDNRLRVVIVEDEAIIAMELEMLLTEMDVEVVGIAMSAAEAEGLVASARPDCVTMDINIQGDRDGVAAAQDIYEKYGIRSIFVSAFGNSEIRARAEAANPIGWITKPVETYRLKETLDRVERNNV